MAGGAGTPTASCRVTGLVQNPSLSETVTVRLAWRGLDATGSAVAIASARIPWLRPGERRPFVSSAFVTADTGRVVPSCEAIPHLERVEIIAEPMPTPGG